MIRLLTIAVLAVHGYRSIAVFADYRYEGFLMLAQGNAVASLVLFDVRIFVVLASVWMVKDSGGWRRAAPFVLLTAAFGSVGPLTYLLVRPGTRGSQPG